MRFFPFAFTTAIFLLSACQKTEPQPDGTAVAVRSVNYNADRGIVFTLYDTSGKPDPQLKKQANNPQSIDGYYPVGGDTLTALTGGGINCCANLPEKWRPGLKYTVVWQEGSASVEDDTVRRHTAELPKYDKAADVTVAFYPNHEAEFVVGSVMAGEAGWKGREKADPLAACMAKHEKKYCYMYLPHYENAYDQSAERRRISCRSVFNGKEPDHLIITKEECIAWEKRCLAGNGWDVSDKQMCKINWRSPEFGE